MPLLAEGGFDALGWGQRELALSCASHGGESEHVALAASMLASVGLDETVLACGPHEPLSVRGASVVRDSGAAPTRLHNNCSGKHSAMIARAVTHQWAVAGYENHDHAVQRDALTTVAAWAGLVPDHIPLAVDGCGVTVFALPLANMALSYARLAVSATAGEPTAVRIVTAMTAEPFLVGGSDRFDSLLMQACEGNVVCKIGAEGVHTLAIIDQGLGIALKVEDGSARAQYAAVLAILQMLNAAPKVWPTAMQAFTSDTITNTRGANVGRVMLCERLVGESLDRAPDGAMASDGPIASPST